MKQTIYEKLQMIKTKPLKQKLSNYIEFIELKEHKINNDIKQERKQLMEEQTSEIQEETKQDVEIKPTTPKPDFDMYNKMRGVGVSDVGIKQKMITNKMEKYWIKYYFGEINDNKNDNVNTENNEQEINVSLREQQKYLKMIKCGIHPRNVKNSMKLKGYDQTTINMFFEINTHVHARKRVSILTS
eukprot:264635_1